MLTNIPKHFRHIIVTTLSVAAAARAPLVRRRAELDDGWSFGGFASLQRHGAGLLGNWGVMDVV